jgi:hypothetical protein
MWTCLLTEAAKPPMTATKETATAMAMAMAINRMDRNPPLLFRSGSGGAAIATVMVQCPLSLSNVQDVHTNAVIFAPWKMLEFVQLRSWRPSQLLLLHFQKSFKPQLHGPSRKTNQFFER